MWNEHSPRIESALAENKVVIKVARCRKLSVIISFSFSGGNTGRKADTQGIVQSTAEILSERKETRG